MRCAVGGTALGLVLLGSACSMLVDFGDLAFDGLPGEGGGGGTAGQGGMPPAFAVYVSPAGDDRNDGRLPSTPKRTVAAGLEVARGLGGVGEVRVCEGLYPSPTVLIDFDVVLRGGYDCASFEPGQLETRFENNDLTAMELVTLEISGRGVTEATVVEGLHILGAATGASDSMAVRVSDGAAPELRHNQIDGGGGTAKTRAGSIGVRVQNAVAVLRENEIHGGHGTAPGALHFSVGAWCFQGGLTLEANTIDGGLGTGVGAPSAAATVGVRADVCDLESRRNTISGGTSLAAPGGVRGLFINLGQTTSIQQDRIYAVAGDGSAAIAKVYAVEMNDGGPIEIVNSMLMAKVSSLDVADPPIGDPRVGGAILNLVALPVLRHNTILAHCASGYCFTCAVCTDDIGGGVTIEDNLLFGMGWDPMRQPTTGILLSETSPISSVRGNAAFGIADVFVRQLLGAWAYFSDAEADANPLLDNVEGNRELKSDCQGKPSCVPSAGCDGLPSGCVATIFEGFAIADHGLATLHATGWKLAPNPPCALSESAYENTIAEVPVDHYGTPRTAAPSAGAHEYEDACTP
jgi:hypothetical protein